MKNKWYEVLGAGLLSVSAMYLCTALVVTGCSVDGDSLDALDANETSEVVESGNDEEIEPSEVEESSKAKETSKEEVEASESEEQEPAEAEETADAEEKSEQTESEELAESGDVAAPEEPAEPEGSAKPEESAEPKEPNNDTEPGENVEPKGNTEPNENVEPDVDKKVARHTREWYRLRDTVSYFIAEESRRDANALQKLEDKGYSFITRCEWDSEVEDCSMDDSEFHAAYNGNEDVMHKLTDAGILWDGSEWEGWNPIEDGESSVVLDTVLSAWSNDRIYVHAVYRVRYYLDSDPNAEHSFLLDVPVKYMRVD